jgi:hypothetical protein
VGRVAVGPKEKRGEVGWAGKGEREREGRGFGFSFSKHCKNF